MTDSADRLRELPVACDLSRPFQLAMMAAALREGARLCEPDEGGWCEAGCHDECRDRLRALADELDGGTDD